MSITLWKTSVLAAALVGCGQEQHSAAAARARVDTSYGAVADTPTPPAPRAHGEIIEKAAAALEQGRPWVATTILAPLVRERASRSPDAVMLAARAAAAWGGWRRAEQLLAAESWLDDRFAGDGRALLARAALELRRDTLAASHARRAVAAAERPSVRGERLVVLARALDRMGDQGAARAAYAEAAGLLPEVEDWLRLRAAEVTPDSTARAALYAALRLAPARDRAPWTEARARERAGDLPGAAAAFDALGARADAFRLRLAAAPRTDTAARGELRRAMVAFLASGGGRDAARGVRDLLDRHFAPLTVAEDLTVARSAALVGTRERAAAGFGRALSAGHGTDEDRFRYATILSQLGRDSEAASQFARVQAPASLAARAAYQHARSLLRAGRGTDARAALRRVLAEHARDTSAASSALFLLADLATDDGSDADARAAFKELAARFPTSAHAPAARFRAAIIAFIDGDARAAALELDTLRTRYPGSGESNAAWYWSGRAWAQAGDSAAAVARWREIARREPLSYYALAAARRLGERPWAPPPTSAPLPSDTIISAAAARVALLERLGLESEARVESDRLVAGAERSVDQSLASAAALRELGSAARAIRAGRQAQSAGAPSDAGLYRLLYPVVQAPVLLAEADAHGLDRPLVAALIRQESMFEPRATSPAGARGLMQLMPAVGRQVASGLDFPFWDDALLYQPDVNVRLGTVHLAALLATYDGDEVRALAAYNAGSSRVARWATKRGASDPELFIERIPYVETRDYVRIIQRNRALYRDLYGW